MQLGAFYPFARNHNTFGASPQEPYRWPSVAEISRNGTTAVVVTGTPPPPPTTTYFPIIRLMHLYSCVSSPYAVLAIRYSLLPYYYTLFYTANLQGGMVWRPLIFEFPNDADAVAIDTQFLVGSALMVSPALNQGQTTVQAYFPAAVWCVWITAVLPSLAHVPFLSFFFIAGTTSTPASLCRAR